VIVGFTNGTTAGRKTLTEGPEPLPRPSMAPVARPQETPAKVSMSGTSGGPPPRDHGNPDGKPVTGNGAYPR